MRRIIGITGGVGYIGSSLAKRITKSFDVNLIDIREPKETLQKNVCFQQCDVRNYKEVKKSSR
jgi:nucleoside-diphosphate-sugar epimerase